MQMRGAGDAELSPEALAMQRGDRSGVLRNNSVMRAFDSGGVRGMSVDGLRMKRG